MRPATGMNVRNFWDVRIGRKTMRWEEVAGKKEEATLVDRLCSAQ